MNITPRHTFLLVVIVAAMLFGLRFTKPFHSVISWDVKGYYLYLPARFIYNDPLINDLGWVKELQEKYQTTATLFMLNPTDHGSHVIKFTMGLSWLYSPMFLAGHAIALLSSKWPADGFSPPYQYALALGVFIYVFLGLLYLRKVLHAFFDNKVVFVTILLMVLGTNLLNQFAFLTVLSHSSLFFLVSALIWSVIRFYRIAAEQNHAIISGDQESLPFFKWDLPSGKLLHGYITIAMLAGFIMLIRPTEAVCVFLFFLWETRSWKMMRQRFLFFIRRPLWTGLFALLALLVVFPQLFYWYNHTGNWFHYSYDNPGEGLDLLAPHTLKFLFSFQKGWLIYTPLMWFSIAGLFILFKRNKGLFLPVLFYFLVSLYLMSSWTAWWYGGGCFSSRTIITIYPALAIPFGFAIRELFKIRLWLRTGLLIIMVFFVFLNLFQTWQFQNGIITLETMTRDYYFRVFLRPSVAEEDRSLLLVLRPLTSLEKFSEENRYLSEILIDEPVKRERFPGFRFESPGFADEQSGTPFMVLDSESPFSPVWEAEYHELTTSDHAWLRGQARIYIPDDFTGPDPLLVMAFTHKGATYKYRTTETLYDQLPRGRTSTIQMDFITPVARSRSDKLLFYIWHRADAPVYLEYVRLEVFTRSKE